MHVFLMPLWFKIAEPVLMAQLAFWCGDWRARAIAGFLFAQFIFGNLLCAAFVCWGPAMLPAVRWRWLPEDVIELALCLFCVWRAKRYWVLVATALVVLVFADDAVFAFAPHISAWAYVSANLVFNHLIYTTVLIGLWPDLRARLPAALGGPR